MQTTDNSVIFYNERQNFAILYIVGIVALQNIKAPARPCYPKTIVQNAENTVEKIRGGGIIDVYLDAAESVGGFADERKKKEEYNETQYL